MKVGTDGVLLGAWASVADVPAQDAARPLSPLYLLDIGTGTGLVALMLAQRAASGVWGRRPFAVTAVEREAAAAAQAQENVSASPWASMVTVVTADIRTWRPAGSPVVPGSAAGEVAPLFDLIACNPPFFSDSLKGPDAARRYATAGQFVPFGRGLAEAGAGRAQPDSSGRPRAFRRGDRRPSRTAPRASVPRLYGTPCHKSQPRTADFCPYRRSAACRVTACRTVAYLPFRPFHGDHPKPRVLKGAARRRNTGRHGAAHGGHTAIQRSVPRFGTAVLFEYVISSEPRFS